MDSNSRPGSNQTDPALSPQRAGLSGDALFARERGAREKVCRRAVGPARRGQILFYFDSRELDDDRAIHLGHAGARAASPATVRSAEVNSGRAFVGIDRRYAHGGEIS